MANFEQHPLGCLHQPNDKSPITNAKHPKAIPAIKRLKAFFITVSFGGGFFGFNLLLLTFVTLGIGNTSRIFTVPYRIGFVLFSLVYIIYGISKRSFVNLRLLWLPLLTFWLLYSIQIAWDGYLDPIYLGMPPLEYIQRAIGMTCIPMFIFLNRLGDAGNKWAFRAMWLTVLGCCLYSLVYYREAIEVGYRQSKYGNDVNVAYLSTIMVSYFGVIAFCIAVQRLSISLLEKVSMFKKIYLLGACFVGLVVLFLGGTRSALIASILVPGIIFISSTGKRNFALKIKIFMMFVFISFIFFFAMEHFGAEMTRRYDGMITGLSEGSTEVGGGRPLLYKDTLLQILESPAWGSCLELKTIHFYPHNHILEAFMATGVLGGVSFLILSWTAIKRCFKILRQKREYGWIACLFLIFFLKGLFSGSIIGSHLWFSMMAVYSVPLEKKNFTNPLDQGFED